MKYIILQGSSRSNGNSNKIAKIIQKKMNADLIDLKKKSINSYNYEHQYHEDDFLEVMRNALKYDTLIFITPVYWFSMSGIMKTFFDRITDCLRVEKDLGRRLRGKNMIAISCGSGEEETEGFFIPFKKSSSYLGMNYLGDLHTWIDENEADTLLIEKIESFLNEKTKFDEN